MGSSPVASRSTHDAHAGPWPGSARRHAYKVSRAGISSNWERRFAMGADVTGLRCGLRMAVATGAIVLAAGCTQQPPQYYQQDGYDPGSYGRLSPMGRAAVDGLRADHARGGTYYQPVAPPAEPPATRSAARPAEEPAAPPPASSWGLIPQAEAAPRARPPAPPRITESDPAPERAIPASAPAAAAPLRSSDPPAQPNDRCGWWRLRQLWC